MTQVLFGAEADKIQATLFRAARQRHVVGGSRLLNEFGEFAARRAQKYHADAPDVLVTKGGNFRILFPTRSDAENFGRELADAYRLLLDASLTLAPPEDVSGRFEEANVAVGESIRRLKRARRGMVNSPHVPTTAFCQASGVGLAAAYDFDYRAARSTPASERQYLSKFAQAMAQSGKEKETHNKFLDPFREFLTVPYRNWKFAEDVEDIAAFDGARKNVAYLIADGNSMGELFGECDRVQLQALSEELEAAMQKATAFSLPILAQRLQSTCLPALPLILAGDDAFVLLPAQYALDFAQQFCLEFEKVLRESTVVNQLRDKARDQSDKYIPPPTMSAVVVICKGHYPYHLAHRRGEELLRHVKQLVKTVGQIGDNSNWRSALAFDFKIGSELVAAETGERHTEFRSTLGVYWATQTIKREDRPLIVQPLTDRAQQAALPIARVFGQRWDLKNLPAKRIEQARELFSPEFLPRDEEDLEQRWTPLLRKLHDRIAATEPAGQANMPTPLMIALSALGDETGPEIMSGHWRAITRPSDKPHRAHGLPDLIAMWDYAQSLDRELSDYQREER